ncbi:uncharacterized protein N7482_001837 [Penicillium canariense]|uniref:S-adenosyl-L-methionine-dependent methyltransferase n=1 Tax=Penicillium canariense TaxID=189055 RepID=A0A9W9IHD4_9EURO|nr:uncharacterized protein N7482_001837 [Penicillium canariense]KAJ5175960.1 hypothetical protein N7482_001837 [Penicillium canariense]
MTSPDSQTVELGREFLDTVIVQGREYQKYSTDNRIYFGPVDEVKGTNGFSIVFVTDNQSRRKRSVLITNTGLFDDRLIFPPVHRLRRVLDCGHGAASWAIEVAEQYPNCELLLKVIGVDIAPHMSPDDVDDLNQRFTFPPNHFDLVHSRLLATGIHRSRWPSYIRDIVRVLRPGGWVQMTEMYFNVQSDNGSLTDQHALRRWSTQYMRALEDRKELRIGSRLRSYFTESGLVEVDTKMIPLPLMREIGHYNSENIQQLLRSLALYPLTHRLHMSPQSFDRLVEQAQEEARSHSLKAYFPLYVCIGRKRQ